MTPTRPLNSGSLPRPGALVRANLPQILEHCHSIDPGETVHLQGAEYSNDEFKLNFPFLRLVTVIELEGAGDRYWSEVHSIGDEQFRVTSQWYDRNIPGLIHYLRDKGLEPEGISSEDTDDYLVAYAPPPRSTKGGARFRSSPIGDSQNLLVRYVLGQLEFEAFSEKHWLTAKNSLGFSCVYCGTERDLVIDHAVPISRDSLGEHRLGNLVPACRSCNSSKSQRRYDDFLSAEAPDRIALIETHMGEHGYEPLVDRLDPDTAEEVRHLLNSAREKVADAAANAIDAINDVLARAESVHR
ncbi:HNH endonuclease [Mumia flava]|uniref:HNH endonuclease n=1 Tax=Mumia flava TaxID=1348852 RepID=A0A2M9B733_9ACTN|nr:HNH endonuclease signature motif containing protein [Mumia flava]PJJ53759.1 HNH endonuclease [Mumia flava]